MLRSVAFGEILWDIIEGEPHLGGAPFNFACHLARLGTESFIVSRLGKDELGERAMAMASQHGVNARFLQQDTEHPTGTVAVTLEKGQPDYTIFENVAYDFIDCTKFNKSAAAEKFDIFYFGTLIQRNATSANALKTIFDNHAFAHIFYDVNLRKRCYSKDTITWSLEKCNILKLNTDEVGVISRMLYNESLDSGKFAARVSHDYTIAVVVITAADKGCLVFENGVMTEVEGVKIELCDAIGAGDAFSAAFVYGYLNGKDVVEAARLANHVGAYVASQKGAIPTYSDEIRSRLSKL
jgi:fructokinase